MTLGELREATLRLSVGDRWKLLWEILRSLTGLRGKTVNSHREVMQPIQSVGLERYRGILNLTQDPLDYQKQVRSEWD